VIQKKKWQSRDETGKKFRDPTQPVTCLFDKPAPVGQPAIVNVDRFLTGRLTGKFSIYAVSKNRTPKIFWHNFAKASRLWIIFGTENQEATTY